MSAPTIRKATMRDVSRLAGVSQMTVSRVLAEPDRVTDITRKRVMEAIDQLGYVPDRVAGSLSSRRTNFVTVILPTLTNSNFADTVQGLAEALRPKGYELLIGYTMYSLSEEERIIRTMLERRPDAIVIAGTVHTKTATAMLLRAGIPIIEIWGKPDKPINHSVGFSNYEVGRAAARYLLSLGHHRIGAIGSRTDAESTDLRGERRLQGFSAVLREAGILEDLIVREGTAPVSYQHGALTISALLERVPDVEAVFAVSDVAAFGALMECQRRGIKVPQDLSIMGFGDFDIASQTVPSISTIRVDAGEIGRRTGQLLLELIDTNNAAQPDMTSTSLDIGFQLIERDTTMRNPTR